MKRKEKTKKEKTEAKVAVETIVSARNDRDCPIHGNLKARGRIFEGRVIRKFPSRVTIEFERMVYIRKYERYAKLRTKLHARLPWCMEKDVDVDDLVRIQECRPLSKIIHFVVIKKIKSMKQESKLK